MAICPDRERGKWTPKVDMGKLVKSLLFARFIINRTSSCKSGYELITVIKGSVFQTFKIPL
jgi:hypothetical protein